MPGIVTAFDVVKNIRSRLGSRLVVLAIHPFTLEHAKETLGGGVVGTAAHGAHATGNLVRQEPLILFRGKSFCFRSSGRPKMTAVDCIYNVRTILYSSRIHKEAVMASTETREAGRGETINLRASQKQKMLIDRAAEALGRSRSDFMLETACREAETVLLDRRYFDLSSDELSALERCSTSPRLAILNCGGSCGQGCRGTNDRPSS